MLHTDGSKLFVKEWASTIPAIGYCFRMKRLRFPAAAEEAHYAFLKSPLSFFRGQTVQRNNCSCLLLQIFIRLQENSRCVCPRTHAALRERRREIERRVREVKEWNLPNEAGAALELQNVDFEKIIARFRWFTLLSQLYGWFILGFFFQFDVMSQSRARRWSCSCLCAAGRRGITRRAAQN